jgi:hypothetical protein
MIHVRDALPIVSLKASPALIIRLGKASHNTLEIESGHFRAMSGYSENMSEVELYDSGRAWWKVSESRIRQDDIQFFVLSYQRVVLAVYEIESVFGRAKDRRKAFVGKKLTSGGVLDEYFGMFGKQIIFPKTSANPIYYWPPK